MRNYAATVALALLALLALAGCSGSVDGPMIEGNRQIGGTDADVFGQLIVESGCLYLSWPDSGIRFPVIWPHGTAWDSGQSAVVLPGGTLAYHGDWVDGAGGYHSHGLDHYTVAEGVELAMTCVDNQYGEVAVFNPSGDVNIRR